jgi:hypothetical protein
VNYLGLWGMVDYLGHRLHLPHRVQNWLCHRYDAWLGV